MQEERFRFVIEIQKNERTFRVVCEEFGISRPTGNKWWRRYSEARVPQALEDLSRAAFKDSSPKCNNIFIRL